MASQTKLHPSFSNLKCAEIAPQKKDAVNFCCGGAIPIALIIIGSLALAGIMTGVGAIHGTFIALSGVVVLLCIASCCVATCCAKVANFVSLLLFGALLAGSALVLAGHQWEFLTIHNLSITAIALGAFGLLMACFVFYSTPPKNAYSQHHQQTQDNSHISN